MIVQMNDEELQARLKRARAEGYSAGAEFERQRHEPLVAELTFVTEIDAHPDGSFTFAHLIQDPSYQRRLRRLMFTAGFYTGKMVDVK